MSVEVTADVKRHSESRLADRLVLLELADEAGHDGWVLIRVKTICEHQRLGVSTVLKSLKSLEDAQEIERYSGKGVGRASVYRVLLGRPVGEALPDRIRRLQGYPDHGRGVSKPGTPGIQDVDTPADSKESCPGIYPVAAKPRDLLFEAVCKAARKDWHGFTGRERGKMNAAVAQLRQAGATPDQVKVRAGRWPHVFPGATFTEQALVNHWTLLAPEAEPEPYQCPPHRWADMGEDGRYCLACKTWDEKEDT